MRDALVAEVSKQKKLSEGIQLDAVEMVRRAERALGVAIRKGQEAGEITTNATGPAVREGNLVTNSLPSPSSFFNGNGQATHETYVMTDNISDEEFDAVLAEAKGEGNLSRSNVVRKIKNLPTHREAHRGVHNITVLPSPSDFLPPTR